MTALVITLGILAAVMATCMITSRILSKRLSGQLTKSQSELERLASESDPYSQEEALYRTLARAVGQCATTITTPHVTTNMSRGIRPVAIIAVLATLTVALVIKHLRIVDYANQELTRQSRDARDTAAIKEVEEALCRAEYICRQRDPQGTVGRQYLKQAQASTDSAWQAKRNGQDIDELLSAARTAISSALRRVKATGEDINFVFPIKGVWMDS